MFRRSLLSTVLLACSASDEAGSLTVASSKSSTTSSSPSSVSNLAGRFSKWTNPMGNSYQTLTIIVTYLHVHKVNDLLF